jgi:hypothetical protein
LLLVVSARRRLTWGAFRQAFDLLHARALSAGIGVDDTVPYVRQKSLRLLGELGHCELPPYGGGALICIAPTVLARLPLAGLPAATLCGSRGSDTVARLRQACTQFGSEARVVAVRQRAPGGYAPIAIRVEVTNARLLAAVAAAVGVRFAAHPPAWALLRFSASLAEYEARLVWTSDPDPAWPRRDFDATSLTFRPDRADGPVRLSSFQDPVTHRQIHRLWRRDVAATVDRTWGRWVYLHAKSVQALSYDPQQQAVAVPATVPLPGLLGRALALFSGLAPAQVSRAGAGKMTFDHYEGVSYEAAEVLAAKLAQPLLELDTA